MRKKDWYDDFAVDPVTRCWVWQGRVNPDGYGNTGRNKQAHRVVYEEIVGRIPPTYDLHHTCGNRLCINPGHLEAIPRREHRQIHKRTPTHCPRGHEYNDTNTYIDSKGSRHCKACRGARRKRVV